MARLTICIGLPGSGKTTWAKDQVRIAQVADDTPIVRVNKDDIRARLALKGWVWSQQAEQDVIAERDALIKEHLSAGYDVISDDTNLAAKHQKRLMDIAQQCHATYEFKDFTKEVSVDVCIERDSKREKPVGAAVIKDMASKYLGWKPQFTQYVKPEGKPGAIICDLDGTLCIHTGRSPYDTAKCGTDLRNDAIFQIVCSFSIVLLVSGRSDKFRDETVKWLEEHDVDYSALFMRKDGDTRKDWIIKGEIFDEHIRDNYNVLFVLDDRNQVVDFWRSIGLTCLQVAPGDF